MKKAFVGIYIFLGLISPSCNRENISGNVYNTFNFNFEKEGLKDSLPYKWFQWGDGTYDLHIDSVEKYSGRNAVSIVSKGDMSEKSFGCIVNSIPANYEGKIIELRGYLKFENVSNGAVGLLIRIDGESGPLQITNMLEEETKGSKDWKLYSVKLPYNQNAKIIHVGALLSGNGKLWVDDFRLLIDGKDIGKIKPTRHVEYKANNDHQFDKGSAIGSLNLSDRQVADLVILGQVWGFLKYYHPAIAYGEYNWDYALFRVMPDILGSKNKEERNSILADWIDSLGEVTVTSKELKSIKSKAVKVHPDLTWIEESILGNKLAGKLNHIKSAKRPQNHYYVKLTLTGNPEFKNEKAYIANRFPDLGYRLLALFRYWNIIQYYYPYKYLIGEDWNKVLVEFIPKLANAKSEIEYKQTILSLITKVNDTHANIWGEDSVLEAYQGKNYAPLEISFVENKAVITGFSESLDRRRNDLQIGDIIETVNGETVTKIVSRKLNSTPASNYSTKLRDIAINLLRTNKSSLVITYRRGKIIYSTKIKCSPINKIDAYNRYYHQNSDTCFKLIKPHIAYLYPGSLKRTDLFYLVPKILKTNGLIIDMRCYPSDFIVFSLGKHLMASPTNFAKFSKASIETPGLFSFTTDVKVGDFRGNFYKGKVVILVNERTQSQAEYTAMAFRKAPKAIVIGSTTAGADGNISHFFLPGGIGTAISGLGVYYPDGKETQRIGIVPDLVVMPTIKGISENRDELLEKAIKIIDQNETSFSNQR